MLLANFGVIHLLGLLQLGLWLKLIKGTPASLVELLQKGTLPFVVGDILKIALAAATTKLAAQDKNS
jgi:biotin transport system substrate-specific component